MIIDTARNALIHWTNVGFIKSCKTMTCGITYELGQYLFTIIRNYSVQFHAI